MTIHSDWDGSEKQDSGPLSGPPFPGEDFLFNALDGLTFPVDLAGEIQEKFRTLVGLRLSEDRVLDLEQRLRGVELEENVAR